MSTFVLKIDNDNVQNIQKTISDIISSPMSGSSQFNDTIITFMSKSEYSEYILKSVGSSNDISALSNDHTINHSLYKGGLYPNRFSKDKKTINKCSICNKVCNLKQKLYTLNICNHQFHHKCINKIYKEKSAISNGELLSCPMCNSSTEELCTFC